MTSQHRVIHSGEGRRVPGPVSVAAGAAALGMVVAVLGCASDAASGAMFHQGSDWPVLRLPVEGMWRLVRSPGHEEFAFDLAAVEQPDGRTLTRSRLRHASLGAAAADSHSWERPVYAPVRAEVVTARDGWPDRERLHLLWDAAAMIVSRPASDADDLRPFAGNHVILRADGFYVLLAHLRRGSLRVTQGDRVEVGELVGRIGNSGLSLEPHLHLQLLDRIDDLHSATAPPFVVSHYERWTSGGWMPVKNAPLRRGDVIRSPSLNADNPQL